VYVYTPDGTPFERNGTNVFGAAGIFDADEEGIALYTFPTSGIGDNGAGFIVVSDQRADQSDFEFFDRRTWQHLGTLRLDGVSNTDGIASTQRALPGYPLGVFAAINDDTTTAVVGWHEILGSIATPYQIWALSRGLTTGVNTAYLDDPDNDGLSNMREFATNDDPLSPVRSQAVRTQRRVVNGEFQFDYTFPVRNGAVFTGSGPRVSAIDGLVYRLAGGFSLSDFNAEVVEVIPPLSEGLPAQQPGWSYRTFRLANPPVGSQHGYLRLSVRP
jgi:hypothetical protein